MSGWSELVDLGMVVRPFDGLPPAWVGNSSPFSAPWRSTVSDLARELTALSAARIVLELDITEADLRLDGLPRANAKVGQESVRISFQSKWGPLRYETGEYWHWQDNVRAVALSMRALRMVDRYGVSKRGEQYRGWRQIPMTTGNVEDTIVTREDALAALAEALNEEIHPTGIEAAIRRAIRKTHPDTGGDERAFRSVIRAREVLTG